MITLSNLKGEHCQSDPMTHSTQPVTNTQSGKKFWRRVRHSKNLITAESSAGGKAQISMDDIWKLLESADDKLKVPADVSAKFKK